MTYLRSRDWRSGADLAAIIVGFVLLGGAAHLLTGREVGATISGAALGFLVSESARWRRERERERWVRRALRLEFERNLLDLETHWGGAGASPQGDPDAVTSHRSRFKAEFLPLWTRVLWNSQAGQLGGALTEAEMTAAMRMQADFDRLMILRERLGGGVEPGPEADELEAAIWRDIEGIVTAMLGRGNPVRSRLEAATRT